MTEYELVNQALMLERNTYGVRNRLLVLRIALNTLARKLENLNDNEAKAVYEKYWHQHTEAFSILKNFSQHEIYQLVRKRETVRNVCLQLLKAGQNLAGAALKIRTWRYKIELTAKMYELYKKGRDQSRRENFQNAISQINDMQQAKENMRLVMNLMNNLIQSSRLPFVSEFINLYTTLFDELCRFCDKIADYAKKLEREAEKVLGVRGMWNQALRNPNAAGSRSRQGIADPTLTLDSTF